MRSGHGAVERALAFLCSRNTGIDTVRPVLPLRGSPRHGTVKLPAPCARRRPECQARLNVTRKPLTEELAKAVYEPTCFRPARHHKRVEDVDERSFQLRVILE